MSVPDPNLKLFASPTTLQEFEDYDFQVRMRCGTDPATLIESATTEGTVTTEGTRQFSLTFTQAGNPIPVQGEIEEGQIAILTLTLLPGEQVYSTDIDFKVGFQCWIRREQRGHHPRQWEPSGNHHQQSGHRHLHHGSRGANRQLGHALQLRR